MAWWSVLRGWTARCTRCSTRTARTVRLPPSSPRTLGVAIGSQRRDWGGNTCDHGDGWLSPTQQERYVCIDLWSLLPLCLVPGPYLRDLHDFAEGPIKCFVTSIRLIRSPSRVPGSGPNQVLPIAFRLLLDSGTSVSTWLGDLFPTCLVPGLYHGSLLWDLHVFAEGPIKCFVTLFEMCGIRCTCTCGVPGSCDLVQNIESEVWLASSPGFLASFSGHWMKLEGLGTRLWSDWLCNYIRWCAPHNFDETLPDSLQKKNWACGRRLN